MEKIETPFMFSNFSFRKSCRYEIMWKNTVPMDRPQMTVWCVQIACWIPKATNIHSEYVILIALPLQQWLHKGASVFQYMYIACLLLVFFCFTIYLNFSSSLFCCSSFSYLLVVCHILPSFLITPFCCYHHHFNFWKLVIFSH